MHRFIMAVAALPLLAAAAVLSVLPAAAQAAEAAETTEPVVLYCGRSPALVEPVIEKFTEQTGIEVQVRAAKTAQLALALTEEGERTPADVFWAQDAGTLGAMAKRGVFAALPESTLELAPPAYRNEDGMWIGTSGRLRVLAYAPDRVDPSELPASVFDLTDSRYRGRVGWAPTNASFQAFITAMRKEHGEDKARQWLLDMKANGVKDFPKNTAIVMGIANGEVDLGLPNHYYLLRFKKADSDYPVEQTQFEAGDIGNMNNVAGVGMIRHSDNRAGAVALIEFLLSPQAQQYFVGETFEMPVSQGVLAPAALPDPEKVRQNLPDIDLDALDDLSGTQELLRETGVI